MSRRLHTAPLGAALVAAVLVPAGAPGQAPRDVLPDLVQAEPGDIDVETAVVRGRVRFRLGFESATENLGPGPLTLHGSRASTAEPTMRIDQLVSRSDGTTRRVRGVGSMRYVVHSDHRHWHYVGFERYELRRAGSSRAVRRDRKTGFCLGDRYRIRGATGLPGYEPRPPYTGRCGLGQRRLLELLVGISTGWGDDYPAHLEGQYIDVTGLPAGRYRLVHRANPTGTIAESDRGDNRSSVLLRLSWPRGPRRAPRVVVLRAR